MKTTALILDRDGTLIEHVPYLSDPADVRLLPGVRDALLLAQAAGAKLFLHTNQSGVGRGMFQLPCVHSCNGRLVELLDLGPAPFARICIAAEAPGQASEYRKPSPRFAEEVMREYQLDASEICYVGDRGSDLQTARNAGSRGVGVATGLDDLRLELQHQGLADDYPVFDSLGAALRYLFPDT